MFINQEMVDILDGLQSVLNDGRGVSCVRSIVCYLRRKDYPSAKATCFNEGDKIRNYPTIETMLGQMIPEYGEFLARMRKNYS